MIRVVPDTNVLLHARKLASLGWDHLGESEVAIIIVGPVITEIDKHKMKPGRLGRRAREVSADIRETIRLPERTKVLRDKGPRVTMQIVAGVALHERLHPSLDLNNMDHQIANHCLALAKDGQEVRLLTNDTIASLIAEEVGIPAMILPEDWLLAPEADEAEKKLKQANAEIAMLRSQEPRMTVEVLGADGKPMTRLVAKIRRYPALPAYQVQDLADYAGRICPPIEDFGPKTFAEAIAEEEKAYTDKRLSALMRLGRASTLAMEAVFNPVTEDKIQFYRTVTYPKWLAQLREALETIHHHFNRTQGWPTLELVTANSGTRPAEGVLIEARVRGALRLRRVLPEKEQSDGSARPRPLPSPPAAPRGAIVRRDRFRHLMSIMAPPPAAFLREPPVFEQLLPRNIVPDPTLLCWKPARGKAASMVRGECTIWRHHGEARRESLFVEAVCESGKAQGAIDLTISAHNLSERLEQTLPVDLEVETDDTAGFARALIDDFSKLEPYFRRS
ncbi:PIN domain-containing protein [Novosphingobium sp. KACC 22771]|uniref:PIN domain-containing protein n=1 Tax=Novosphingobium sp. KACC 22771 TaxID=3025670 RepID=UPI002365AA29|nr:PIN domain-containing protein [Novosphingobium sp. KACC 22771]WDF71340.1 PIN domain-containing protein [Novosphingobium sp. KACC 22771]